jgi:type VI protein secretion system component VasF
VTARVCKRCPRCGQRKSAGEFYRRRNGGLSPYCRVCQRIANRATQRRRRRDPATAAHFRQADRQRQRRHRLLAVWMPVGGGVA